MKRAVVRRQVAVVAMLTICAAASASEIGQQVADRIDAATYRYYLDGRLYTHDGDDRGTWQFWKGAEHDPARDNVAVTFQSFGLSVELQGIDDDGLFYNVIGTQLGSLYPDSYYVVGAHYDSFAFGTTAAGADDDASGVAGLLEIARVLSLYEAEYTIKYIAFDIEEWGMDGSYAYVQDHLTDDIRGMVQLDMIARDGGWYGCEVHGTSQSDPIKLALADAVTTYGGALNVSVGGAQNSDHAPFEWAGFQACLLIEQGYHGNPCYHHGCDSVDTPDYISYDYAADFVRSTAGFLADQALAHPLFDCDTGSGCEPGTVGDEDCNGNGVWDVCDVVCGGASDCDGNHVPDECEPDCNLNGIADACDVGAGTSLDCNRNTIPDECEAGGTSDCNSNGSPDLCDLYAGTSQDCNGNAVPDECDIASGASGDCQPNGVPDECEIANGTSQDCNGNGVPDLCEIWFVVAFTFDTNPGWGTVGQWQFGVPTGDGTHNHDPTAGHTGSYVYGYNLNGDYTNYMQTTCYLTTTPIDCTGASEVQLCFWRWLGVQAAPHDHASIRVSNNGYSWVTIWENPNEEIADLGWMVPTFDISAVADGRATVYVQWGMGPTDSAVTYPGWNLDDVQIVGTRDCNHNFVLDDCESGTDCNGNGVLDQCDLASGFSRDCQPDGVLDECELANGTSQDCNWNGIPDECDVANGVSPDCNANGVPDECDLADGASLDCNWNDIPDECELANGTSLDCNGNGIPDECDLANCISTDVNGNGIPDECESVGDLNCDGTLDLADINPFVLYLSNFTGWLAEFPGCDPLNGDINGDGTYGQESLADINPFIELLTHP